MKRGLTGAAGAVGEAFAVGLAVNCLFQRYWAVGSGRRGGGEGLWGERGAEGAAPPTPPKLEASEGYPAHQHHQHQH